jgi:hypothetical protein
VVPDVIQAGGERMDHANRAAVRDHQHLLARVKAQRVREKVVDAGREVLERLRVVCTGTFAGTPALMRFAEALLDLGGCQPFPRTESALAQTISAVSRARARSLE